MQRDMDGEEIYILSLSNIEVELPRVDGVADGAADGATDGVTDVTDVADGADGVGNLSVREKCRIYKNV